MAKEVATKQYRLKPGRKFHVPRTDGVSGTKLAKAGTILDLTPDQAKAFKDAFEPVDGKKAAPRPVVEDIDEDEDVVDEDNDEETDDDESEEDTDDESEDSDESTEEETPKQKRARERAEKKAAKDAKKKKKK